VSVSDDSIYARELSGGFPALRFEQPLEGAFRAHYVGKNAEVRRFGAIQGLLLIGITSLIDWRMSPPELSAASITFRIGVLAPLFALLLLATYPGVLVRYCSRITYACATAFSVSGIYLVLFAQRADSQAHLVEVVLATLFIYLMLGLRLYPALALALPLAAVFVGVHGVDQTIAAYGSVLILFVNVVGAFICQRLEHSARTIFLEREIVNLLSGRDTKTGIPNRRMFNTHLQSLRRQGTRDAKGLALMIVELRHFEEQRRRNGSEAADHALRQIAHTVMRIARRPLDMAARFGDGEFALLLYDPEPEYLHNVVKELRDSIALLDVLNTVEPGASRVAVVTGTAYSGPDQAHDANLLLQAADRALQEAKLEGIDGRVVPVVGPRDGRHVAHGSWRSAADG
jgi:diguanylate cyclase (GGDEF)-like protein